MIRNVIFRPERFDPHESCRDVKIYFQRLVGVSTIYLTYLVVLSVFSFPICIKCKPVTGDAQLLAHRENTHF